MSEKKAKEERREAPVPKFIVWARDYHDEFKRELRQYVVVAGEPPPGFNYFIGTGAVNATTMAGSTIIPHTFAIPGAANVAEAFELWQVAFEASVQKMNKQIIQPGPGGLPPLPGPGSGHPGGGR